MSYKNISKYYTVSRHTLQFTHNQTFTLTLTLTNTSLGWFSCVKYISICLCCVCIVGWCVVKHAFVCECVFCRHTHTKYNSLSNRECKLFESQTHQHWRRNTISVMIFLFFICFSLFRFYIVNCKRIWHHVEAKFESC